MEGQRPVGMRVVGSTAYIVNIAVAQALKQE